MSYKITTHIMIPGNALYSLWIIENQELQRFRATYDTEQQDFFSFPWK